MSEISVVAGKAKLITEITVFDPDSQMFVEVAIYKDPVSGGIFGVDSSFLANTDEDVVSPFSKKDAPYILF